MTTQNHTAVASIVAITGNDSPIFIKVLLVIGLILSHLLVDAIPHQHFYDYTKPETWPGAIIELGGGMLILTCLVWLLTSINPIWLITCVIAASLVDFLVIAGIKSIKKINHDVHYWEWKTNHMDNFTKWDWEITQTIVMFSILTTMIVNVHH